MTTVVEVATAAPSQGNCSVRFWKLFLGEAPSNLRPHPPGHSARCLVIIMKLTKEEDSVVCNQTLTNTLFLCTFQNIPLSPRATSGWSTQDSF